MPDHSTPSSIELKTLAHQAPPPTPSTLTADTDTSRAPDDQEESSFLKMQDKVIEVIKMEPTESQMRASRPLEVDEETE